MEILAALVNGILLLGISVFIIIEAATRLRHPPAVHGTGLLARHFQSLIKTRPRFWRIKCRLINLKPQ